MGHWGWRPLLICIFISVWVAGCNLVSETSPDTSPSPYPHVTLTVGRPAPPAAQNATASARAAELAAVPTPPADETNPAPTLEPTPTPHLHTIEAGDTLLDLALRYGVSLEALRAANPEATGLLQIGQVIRIPPPGEASAATAVALAPTPTPVAVEVDPPTCYETAAGRTLCLGAVENTYDTSIDRVAVEVRLLRHNGASPRYQIVMVEQAIIPPGGFAPYRALFDLPWAQFAGATAVLVSADAAPERGARLTALAIEDLNVEQDGARFVVRAAGVNTSGETVTLLRAVTTLRGASGQVTGYRVASFSGEQLPPSMRLPLQIEIVAQTSEPASATIYIEAERSS